MPELRLEKTIEISPERVFFAFTDEDLLQAWFTTRAQVDLRVGGHYSNADGDRGTYLEIVRPQNMGPVEPGWGLLRFTWDNPGHCPHSEVEVKFVQNGKHTHVTLTHSKLADDAAVEHMRSGWEWALENIKLFLETGNTVGYEEWLRKKTKT